MKRFRWAILGTGLVARHFARALARIEGAELAVVASRDVVNAERFAAQLGGRPASSYEEAVGSPVDACYVATPPSLHLEHVSLCLYAGRPTLVEKPFAHEASEARVMVDLARARGVFCGEAMWTRFLPAVQLAQTMVRAGRVGEPRLLTTSFGIAQVGDPASSLFDAARGGGALLHRGVYGLSLAVQLLGPAEVLAAHLRTGPGGVDQDVHLLLGHEGGACSVGDASLDLDLPNEVLLHGTDGSLRLPAPIYRPNLVEWHATTARSGTGSGRLEGLRDRPSVQALQQRVGSAPLRLVSRLRGSHRRLRAPYAGNGYGYQVLEVMRAVAEGRTESLIMPLDESLHVVELLNDVRRVGQ